MKYFSAQSSLPLLDPDRDTRMEMWDHFVTIYLHNLFCHNFVTIYLTIYLHNLSATSSLKMLIWYCNFSIFARDVLCATIFINYPLQCRIPWNNDVAISFQLISSSSLLSLSSTFSVQKPNGTTTWQSHFSWSHSLWSISKIGALTRTIEQTEEESQYYSPV